MAEYIYNKWASNINLYMPDTLTFTSVHNIPGAHASAVFTSKTSEVFKEEHNIAPIILNEDDWCDVRIVRKQACYVRFAPADKPDVIPYILYANWRNTVSPEDIVLCKTHDGSYLVKQRQAPKQETTQTIRQVQAATASLSFPI